MNWYHIAETYRKAYNEWNPHGYKKWDDRYLRELFLHFDEVGIYVEVWYDTDIKKWEACALVATDTEDSKYTRSFDRRFDALNAAFEYAFEIRESRMRLAESIPTIDYCPVRDSHKHHFVQADEWGGVCVCGMNETETV